MGWQGISAMRMGQYDLRPTVLCKYCQHLKPHMTNKLVIIPQGTKELRHRHGSLDYILEFSWQRISATTIREHGLKPTVFCKYSEHLKPCIMNIPVVISQDTDELWHGGLHYIIEFSWQGKLAIAIGQYGSRPTMFCKCGQCLKPYIMNIPVVIPQGANELRHGSLDHIMEFS